MMEAQRLEAKERKLMEENVINYPRRYNLIGKKEKRA
jgi:hypothetical protein